MADEPTARILSRPGVLPAKELLEDDKAPTSLKCGPLPNVSDSIVGSMNPAPAKRSPARLGLTAWTFAPTVAAVVGLWIGYWFHLVPWWINWLLATPLYCYILICGHDAVHSTAHGNRWINKSVGWTSCLVLGIPFTVIRRAHLSHHARVSKHDDFERFAYVPSWILPVRWVFGNLCYYAIFTKCTLVERVMAGATLAGIGFLLLASPEVVFFGWLLPVQTTWLIFMVLTVYLPHGVFANWINEHIPFVTGFHEDHHRIPSYPWHQLCQWTVRTARPYVSENAV